MPKAIATERPRTVCLTADCIHAAHRQHFRVSSRFSFFFFYFSLQVFIICSGISTEAFAAKGVRTPSHFHLTPYHSIAVTSISIVKL